MKNWMLAGALAAGLMTSAQVSASFKVYDFDFVIGYSSDAAYKVGTTGTGAFAFEETPVNGATATRNNLLTANYGDSVGYLELTINGTTTRLLDYDGTGGASNYGFLLQDQPSNGSTWDLFRMGGDVSRNMLSIFGNKDSIPDVALTGDNVERLWATRNAAYINLSNCCLTANLTALRAVAPAVPEPATWALMLTGFALTGYVLRRRRAAVVAA